MRERGLGSLRVSESDRICVQYQPDRPPHARRLVPGDGHNGTVEEGRHRSHVSAVTEQHAAQLVWRLAHAGVRSVSVTLVLPVNFATHTTHDLLLSPHAPLFRDQPRSAMTDAIGVAHAH